MIERSFGHGRLSVDEQETMPLGQDHAALGHGFSVGDWSVVRRIMFDEFDHAEPVADGQGADGGDELVDGHVGEDATFSSGVDRWRGASWIAMKRVAHPGVAASPR